VVVDRPFGQNLTWKDIQSVWKTDHEIWRLYALPTVEPGIRKVECSIGESPEAYVEVSQSSACVLQCGVIQEDLMLRVCSVCGCEVVTFSTHEPYVCKDCEEKRAKRLLLVLLSLVFTLNIPRATEMPSKQKGAGPKSRATANNKPSKKSAGRPKGAKKKKGKGQKGGLDQLVSGQRFNAPVQSGTVRTTRGARSPPTRVFHRESLGTLTPASTAFAVLQQLM